MFANLDYPDDPETECFEEMLLFKQANAFDFTCSVRDYWEGEETDQWLAKVTGYFNEASKGGCVAVPEKELLGPYSMKVECKSNGFRL